MARPRPWLICYDIANPRRLARVHRHLRDRAVPVQYSVFAARVTLRNLESVLSGLEKIIKSNEDDVRAYPLMERAESFSFGRQILPALVSKDTLIISDDLSPFVEEGRNHG